MDYRRIMIIAGIIVIIAIVAISMLLVLTAGDSGFTTLNILGNGTVKENGTLDVKLENGDGIALKDKDVTVTLKNSEGKVVFNKTVKTQVNGVANVKLTNVSVGEYDVEAAFAGDDSYTPSSVSEKIKIFNDEIDEESTENVTDEIEDETTDVVDTTPTQSSQSYSQSSYQSQSYTPSSSYDDGGSEDNYYDEDGNEIVPVIDEDGNEVIE